MAGRYAPGEKLPRQRELAADLGVTLQPLREALKRLEQVGVVEARHGDATRVRDWRAHGTLDVLAHLGPAVLGDLLEARSLMLREMAGLAAQRRDAARARAIARAGRALRRAECGGRAADRAAAELDFAFFTEVAEAAGNLVFLLILNGIRGVYFEHLDELPVAADVAGLAPGYAALAAAIAARRRAAARERPSPWPRPAPGGEPHEAPRARAACALRRGGRRPGASAAPVAGTDAVAAFAAQLAAARSRP